MRILFDIQHPARLHFFKHAIRILHLEGHDLLITVTNKDVLLDLLKKDVNLEGIPYKIIGNLDRGPFHNCLSSIKVELNLFIHSLKFKPDVIVGGCGDFSVAHVGKLLGVPSIIFDTNEFASLQHYLTDPFADLICTPNCYLIELGKKQLRYNGYRELAYLHPNYWQPNPDILHKSGIDEKGTIIILRFVSWNAIHDIGKDGVRDRLGIIKRLEKFGTVYISSEAKLSPSYEKYKMPVSPENFHHLLYYATLYIGEGATSASEAAMLGTHAVYMNPIKLGYLEDLEKKYDLVYNFSGIKYNEANAIDKAVSLLNNPNLRQIGKEKQVYLQKNTIDVTEYIIKMIKQF
jgi:predicted glycosyltransferase